MERSRMQLRCALAVAAALSVGAVTVSAQDDAELVFNATRRNLYCVAPDVSKVYNLPPAADQDKTEKTERQKTATDNAAVNKSGKDKPPRDRCEESIDHNGFLVQDKRSELRVFRRKFFARYALFVDSVTKIKTFKVENLGDAANLTTPLSSTGAAASKGAVPKGLATSGALTPRTAQDLIAELLNPATATNPVSEIASDWEVVRREAENVRNDARSFQANWSTVVGSPASEDACLPTLTSARQCLNRRNDEEESGHFSKDKQTYSDEDGFRRLFVNDNAAIGMVNSLATLLAQQTPALSNQLSSFDGDLASLRADMNTLAGNVEAIHDASALLPLITEDMTKAQIKQRLIQTLTGGSKPAVDDAELSKLSEQYYRLTRAPAAQKVVRNAQSAIKSLWREGLRQMDKMLSDAVAVPALKRRTVTAYPADEFEGKVGRVRWWADQLDAQYSDLLDQDHWLFGEVLPDKIAGINTQQIALLTRANDIYNNSQVDIPLDVGIVLPGQKGNLRVYFSIYEAETFPRFSIPSTLSGSLLTGNQATFIPLGSPTTATAGTSTSTSTTGSTTATPPPPVATSGAAVTSGSFEVHDRYNATMVAAFAFSPGLKEISITTNTITTGTATGSTSANPIPCSTTAPCTQVTQSAGPGHSSVIVGLAYHPFGYDRFPGADSWKHASQALKHEIGMFGGLSVQNLNDYYFGADLQVAHGIQIMGGINFFRQKTLGSGFVSGGVYPGTPSFAGPDQWTHGAYFGIGLNLRKFKKGFGSVTELGSAAPSTGS
jgi:hypothetical protein